MEGEGRECDFEANDVAFAEGGIRRHEVFGTGHVNLLPRDIAEAVAVGVEADGCVEAGFAAGPAYADVTTAVIPVASGVVWGFYSAEDLAFPVPASLANANICASHAEPFFCSDTSAGKVEQDVWRGIFEVEAGAVRFCF